MTAVGDDREIERRIDAVPWNELFHAYGTAEDTRAHLHDLVGGTDVQAAAAHLGSAIVHSSTVWPATADALRIACDILVTAELPRDAVDGMVAALAEAAEAKTSEYGGDTRTVPRCAREALSEARRLARESEADEEIAFGPGDDTPIEDEVGEIVVEILFSEYPDAADAWMRNAAHRVRELEPIVLSTLDDLERRGAASCDVIAACRSAWTDPVRA